jgi:hypothetical protein
MEGAHPHMEIQEQQVHFQDESQHRVPDHGSEATDDGAQTRESSGLKSFHDANCDC